jgi:peptide deformylase|tara:strand:+ start:722 stop:1294 length:573 start_codon:yes stop_codon:yes gene_type:complete
MIERDKIALIPPTDPRVTTAIAPYNDDMLEEYGFKDRQDLTEFMFQTMTRYGGIGLSANQVGLPFNMFVMGGHPQVEDGLKMACFNPMILSVGDEEIMMKEGCLTYPFIFLSIKRPRKCVAKYTDESGDLKEASLDGLLSRVYQHEYEHMLGRTFTEHASKMKLQMAEKKAKKQIDLMRKHQAQTKTSAK